MTLEAFTGDAAPSIWCCGAWGLSRASVAGLGIGKGRKGRSPTRPVPPPQEPKFSSNSTATARSCSLLR